MAPRAVSNWKGGVCVITGAGSGIGGGLARHAAAAGMHVVGVDVDEPGLARLEKAIRDHGQSIETRRVDLRDEAAVEALADHVFAKRGKVNLLFNNAGVLVDVGIAAMPEHRLLVVEVRLALRDQVVHQGLDLVARRVAHHRAEQRVGDRE